MLTTSVERTFLAMNIIKSKLRSKINDEWFSNLMICYTGRMIFKSLDDVDINKHSPHQKLRNKICRLRLKLCPSFLTFLATPMRGGE
jgi:hypothetical protein